MLAGRVGRQSSDNRSGALTPRCVRVVALVSLKFLMCTPKRQPQLPFRKTHPNSFLVAADSSFGGYTQSLKALLRRYVRYSAYQTTGHHSGLGVTGVTGVTLEYRPVEGFTIRPLSANLLR